MSSFHTLTTIGIVAVVLLSVGAVWYLRPDLFSLGSAAQEEVTPILDVTGTITAVSDMDMTLAVNTPGVPSTITVLFAPDTRTVSYVSTDSSVYTDAMDAYQQKLVADPSYKGMPPAPHTQKTLSLADLSVGQTVSVRTNGDMKTIVAPTAVDVIIRADAPTPIGDDTQLPTDVPSE